jgi:3-methyl-2-oxobutanoate hydroxymethyltransferase
MNSLDFYKKKSLHQKITMLTCYDYTSAKIASEANVDCLLVGDSLAMTMYGESTTLPATLELMSHHVRAVAKGAPNKFIVADMPFLSYRKSLSETVSAVDQLMKAGAHAVKLEGVTGNESAIEHIVSSGVPVMGHLGLTPQSIHMLGGYKVQGRDKSQADLILEGALELERRGCFSIVFECIPSSLARAVTEKLKIPTIGIGAGPDTDGQVLVWQDLLGLNTDFKPKFVRSYLSGNSLIVDALNAYAKDVAIKRFPNESESYE